MTVFQIYTPSLITPRLVSPIILTVDADTVNEGIKNFVKLNYNLNLMNLIISDQQRHYRANMRYYKEKNKNKVGIDYYPVSGLYFD